MREPKKRTIYNNYNLWEDYEELARECLKENGIDNPTDQNIWDVIYDDDSSNWVLEKERLIEFFAGETWILQGYNQLWYGNQRAGYVFTDFMDMFSKAMKDCDYVHIWDENGHMYLECSHHDGTNLYEIKKITAAGIRYLENWVYNWDDKRSEEYVHTMVMKKYSVLPNFAHEVYSCPYKGKCNNQCMEIEEHYNPNLR